MLPPTISVIIVSDYAGGAPSSLDDFRHCLAALARQDFHEPVEFVLSEWAGYRDRIPEAEFLEILRSLRFIYSNARSAFDLKNEGARQARATLVAILDADCDPAPGWLRAAVETLRAHPDIAVVSGRTLSRAETRGTRIVALAGRSVGDEGSVGPTRHIALNNIAYRRAVLLEQPLLSDVGSTGFAWNAQALIRAGHKLWFDPQMEVVHDDWDFDAIRDARRLMGRSLIMSRQLDRKHPLAWLVRLGYASIPIFVITKSALTAKRVVMRRRVHGVRWYEVPASVAAGFVFHLLEVPGMILAFRDRPVRETDFR